MEDSVSRYKECMKIHSLNRGFQLKNRFVGSAYATAYSLAELHFVTEVDAYSDVSPSHISNVLLLNKVAVTRLAQGLKKKKFITERSHPSDRRRKIFLLTEKGKKELEKVDDRANAVIVHGYDLLGHEKSDRLYYFYKLLAEGYGCPPFPLRASMQPLRVQIGRLTRAMGLFTPHVFSAAELNALEWFIVTELKNRDAPMSAREFCKMFATPANTMSDAIRRMTRRGLIRRSETASSDRRRVPLELTPAGRKIAEKIEAKAADRIFDALKGLGLEELTEFRELLEIFLEREQNGSQLLVRPRITFSMLTDNAARGRARAFFVQSELRAGRADKLPEVLFAAASFCFMLQREEKIEAVCEIQNESGSRWRLCNFAQVPPHGEEDLVPDFLSSCVEQYFKRHPRSTLVAAANGLPEMFLRKFELDPEKGQLRIIQ